MAIIKLKDVSKIYGLGEATTVALEDVELTINKGEFVAIMGPSGSGKSTLLNIIGLLDSPSHGLYQLENRSVEKLRPNARAKIRRDKIGFIFQQSSLLPKMTVLDNVALPLAYKGRIVNKRIKIAHAMLERVGLTEREYFLPHQLSGGQLQRAVIARALINEPSIIIADEPTGNLDSRSTRVVMELLKDVHKMGNTVLMVTHNPELTRYAGRVLYMYDGSIQHDVQKKVGAAATKKDTKLFAPEGSVEDDLQSVAARMSLEAEKESKKKPTPAKRKPRKRKAVRKSRTKKGKKNV